MRSRYSYVLGVILALDLALAVVPAAAQTPARPAEPANPPAEAPAQEEPEPHPAFYRPVIRVGQNYTLPAGETVYEVTSFLGDVTIEGRVDSDVVVTLGSVRLGSSAVVNGTLAVIGGSATIAQGASLRQELVVIGGELNAPAGFYADGTQVIIGTPAVGHALRGLVPWLTRGLLWGRLIVPDLRWIWVIVGIVFLVGLAVNALFDRPVRACADAIVARPLSSFLLGLFVLLLSVPAVVILAASVIGIVIVPFVLCAIAAAAIVGKVGVARAIGGTLLREHAESGRVLGVAAFVAGFAVLCVAYTVPIIGLVTWAITGALGLGAAAITFRVALRRERPAPTRPPEVPAPPVTPSAYPPPPPPFAPSSTAGFDASGATPEGGPAPAMAAPPIAVSGLAAQPRAAFLDRVAAFALDCILVAIAVELLNLTRYDGAYLFWLLAYHIGFWAWRGTTLGGIIVGLRVVRLQGTDIRPIDAVVRGLASIFSLAALGVGCLWMLQDPERQMWHDKIAGTVVVKMPRELLLA